MQVETGDNVLVDGKLGWKSTLKKDGSKLGLVITSWTVEILSKGAAAVEPPALVAEGA